jgi:hypothetical protein
MFISVFATGARLQYELARATPSRGSVEAFLSSIARPASNPNLRNLCNLRMLFSVSDAADNAQHLATAFLKFVRDTDDF